VANDVESYLKELQAALSSAGADPALVQDALFDAEEYLQAEMAVGGAVGRGTATYESRFVAAMQGYGSPDEVAAAYLGMPVTGATAAAVAAAVDAAASLAAPEAATANEAVAVTQAAPEAADVSGVEAGGEAAVVTGTAAGAASPEAPELEPEALAKVAPDALAKIEPVIGEALMFEPELGIEALVAEATAAVDSAAAAAAAAEAAAPGTEAVAAPPACRNCGEAIRPDARFCTACGAPVEDATAAASGAVPTATASTAAATAAGAAVAAAAPGAAAPGATTEVRAVPPAVPAAPAAPPAVVAGPYAPPQPAQPWTPGLGAPHAPSLGPGASGAAPLGPGAPPSAGAPITPPTAPLPAGVQAGLAAAGAAQAGAGAEPSIWRQIFGVFVESEAWRAVLYMIIALGTGIAYFTIVVTGLSMSVGMLVLIIGIPLFLLVLLIVRGLALFEGRVVELLLGTRMPRRPRAEPPNAGFFERIWFWVKDGRTWASVAYMLLMLPLGIIYFTIAVTGLATGISLVAAPLWAWAENFTFIYEGVTYHWWFPLWGIVPAMILGFLVLVVTLHVCKWIGRGHAAFAKAMLVRLSKE
jgi:hypothetical protein